MKKIIVLVTVLVVFFAIAMTTGCKKNSSPAAPASTNTPNYTETYVALFTHTNSPTFTVTATITKTGTSTPTSTVTPTFTSTSTNTNSPTPIASYTNLVSVPGGTFTQADTSGNGFSHTISPFKIGTYQVTYDLWSKVHTWAISNGYTFQNAGAEGSNGASIYQPVTTVNWRDAIVWCNAYSQMTGLTPVYCSNAAFTTPIISSISGAYSGNINTTAGSFDNPYVNWSANGYRLPTEGEYQYAASYINGSSWTPYNYASGATAAYTDEAATDLVGWDGTNSGGATHVVGGLAANALGIYDMSGNVLEWCFDGYGTYPTTAQSNYTGPASGSARILRGGYYNYTADYLQVGLRIAYGPYMVNAIFGFRFARTD